MSFQDTAVKILQEEGKPMTAEEITQKALQRGLISTKGKTPSATMGSRIYMSIKTLGEKSPFIKVAKNRFALRVWQETSQQVESPEYSFKYAAIKVLREEKKPLDFQTITDIAMKRNYLKTAGKTPHATMGFYFMLILRKMEANHLSSSLAKTNLD